MKSSSNTFGLLIFVAIATTAFVYMAKRPPIDGNAISFGMPIKGAEDTTQTPKESSVESQTGNNLSETETKAASENNTPAEAETKETDSQTKSSEESTPTTEPAAN